MSDIFLSYAKEDKHAIRPLAQALESCGWSVFWDQRIPPGKTWREWIGKALDQCHCVVVVWSIHSISSEWVAEEADSGRQRNILVPVFLNDVIPPLGFRAIQGVHLLTWNGTTHTDEFKQLRDSIAEFVHTSKAARLGESQPVRQVHVDDGERMTPSSTVPAESAPKSTSQQISAKKQTFRWQWLSIPAVLLIGWQLSPRLTSIGSANPQAGTSVTTTPDPEPSATTEPRSTAIPAAKLTEGTLPVHDMVLIPAGTFLMGSDKSDKEASSDEYPQRRVTVNAFKLAKMETTRAQFAAFVTASGYSATGCRYWSGKEWKQDDARSWESPGFAQDDDHPVVCVSHEDAEAYARWLSGKTGFRYRLPTEAEWEYAVRGQTKSTRFWGNDVKRACDYANVADLTAQKNFPNWEVHPCKDDFVYTAPVGRFAANAYRLHDMLGNVWEWVADCWHDNYQGAPADGSAWQSGSGGQCERRVMRGGSWYGKPRVARSAYRDRLAPDNRNFNIGFRLAQDI